MSILFLLLGLLLALCAGVVILSGAILWYEMANGDPALLEERRRGDRLLVAARYLAAETFLLFLTILLRPLGWLKGKERRQETVFDRTPVLLLHGLFHNRGCWWWFGWQLRRRGFTVVSLDLPLWRDPAAAVEVTAAKIAELVDRGAQQVHLVGHSMGGLIARACLHRPEAARHVGRCILLGTPNAGSRLASFAVSPTGEQLRPGSDYLHDLNADPPPAPVRVSSIYSRHDNLIIPWESSRLEGARNIELAAMGHTTLLYHPAVLEVVIAELTEELP